MDGGDRSGDQPAMAFQIKRPDKVITKPRAAVERGLGEIARDPQLHQQLRNLCSIRRRCTPNGRAHHPGQQGVFKFTTARFAGQQQIGRSLSLLKRLLPERNVVVQKIDAKAPIANR